MVVGKVTVIKLLIDDIMFEVAHTIFGRELTVFCNSIGNIKLGREQQISWLNYRSLWFNVHTYTPNI